MQSEPRVRLLFQPVADWISTVIANLGHPDALLATAAGTSAQAGDAADAVINAILVLCQELQKAASAPISLGTDGDAQDSFISDSAGFLRKISLTLRIQTVISCVDTALSGLHGADGELAATLIRRMVPFLERFLCVVHDHLVESALWTRAAFKLTNVLCSTATNVAQNGWCQPKEVDDKEGDGEGADQQVEGTGLGSGTGDKNVSNEIEDESQVEGLQDETTEEQENGEKNLGDKDNTVEMSEDFAGAMEDVEQPDENEKEDDEDEDEEEEAEDRVDDVDPTDPNAVDEKMWDDDSGPEAKDSDDKTQKGAQDQKSEVEMGAKDDEKQRKKDKEAKEAEPSDQQQDDGPEDAEGDADGEEEGPDDEPVGEGGKLDEYAQEGDALDLPEDLDLAADEPDKAGSDDDGMEDEQEDEVPGAAEPDDAPLDEGDERHDTADQPMEDVSEEAPGPDVDDTMTAQPDVSAGNDHDGLTEASGGGGGMEKNKRDEKSAMEVDASPETAQDAEATDREAAQSPRSVPRPPDGHETDTTEVCSKWTKRMSRQDKNNLRANRDRHLLLKRTMALRRLQNLSQIHFAISGMLSRRYNVVCRTFWSLQTHLLRCPTSKRAKTSSISRTTKTPRTCRLLALPTALTPQNSTT